MLIFIKYIKGSNSKSSEDCIDPHKICSLEANIKRMKEEIIEQRKMWNIHEGDIRRKLDIFEQKMVTNINSLKKQ